MVRDAQINPLSRRLVHVDFLRVDIDAEVHVTVPMVLTGKAVGTTNGGQLHQSLHMVPVAAKPAVIPTKLEVDVSALEIGDALHISDLKLGAGVRVLLDARDAIASVVAPKAEKVEAETAAPVEGAVPAEGAAAAAGAAPAAGAAAPRPAPRKRAAKRRRREVTPPPAPCTADAADAPRGRAGKSWRTSTRTTGTIWVQSGGRAPSPRARPRVAREVRGRAVRGHAGRRTRPALQAHGVHERQRSSGRAGSRFWKVPAADVIVVHDELDLPFGPPQAGRRRGPRRSQRRALDAVRSGRRRVRPGAGRRGPPRRWPRSRRLRCRISRARRTKSSPRWWAWRPTPSRRSSPRRPADRHESLQRKSSEPQRTREPRVMVTLGPPPCPWRHGTQRPEGETHDRIRNGAGDVRRQANASVNAPKRPVSARDMAGRKREYETIYILRPDSTTDVIAQVNQKIRTVVEGGGGTLLKVDNWGKRKLAYEVKKQLKGMSCSSRTSAPPASSKRWSATCASPTRYPLLLGQDGRERRPGRAGHRDDRGVVHQGRHAGAGRRGHRDRPADARSPFDDDEGAFDFEEAVFGSADEPPRRPGRGLSHGIPNRRPKAKARARGRRSGRQEAARGAPQAVQVLRG